jgi:hypothetical protein
MARSSGAASRGKQVGARTASGWGVATLFVVVACGSGVVSGCAGLASNSNAAPTPQEAIQISPSDITFANVAAGQKSAQTATLTNTGTETVTITSLALSSSEFSASGLPTPFSVGPGQSAKFQVVYTGSTSTTVSGTLSAMTAHGNSSSKVKLKGSGAAQLSLSATALNFGNVLLNGSGTQAVTLKNPSQTDIQITQVSVTGGAFTVSGLTAPVTVAAGQSVALQAKFAPTAAGAVSGAITVTSTSVNPVSSISLSGTGVSGTYTMSLSPTSLNFGNVSVGSNATQNVQLSNTGNSSVTVAQVVTSGTGVSVSGVTTPFTIAPSQSVTMAVRFAPATSGAISGSLTVTNNQGVNAQEAVTGTGVQAGLTVTATSLSFGSVALGTTSSQTVQVQNSGTANLTISQATASGAGFSVSGLTLPLTLTPGQSGTLSVKYTPQAAGSVTGAVSIASNAPNNPATISLSGTGVQAGLSVTPSSASFGSVVTGTTNSQTVQVKNTGTSNLTISQAVVTGAGFSVNGLVLPLTLTPGKSGTFNVQYAPQAAGNVTGAVSIVSNAPNSPATIALSGTGIATSYTISVNPGSLSFGSVNKGSTAAQSFTITNTGNSNVAISGVAATGAGYSIVSGAGAVTLSPNQSTSVSVQFAPSVGGSASGSATVLSNATGGGSTVSLSGTGVVPTVQHSIALNWAASTTSVAGYNVYRSTVSGSSYAKMNASPVGGVSYADSSVQSGQTYYYVATSVDASGNESVYSNEVSAVIP